MQRSYSPPEEITSPANAELLMDDVLQPAPEAQRTVHCTPLASSHQASNCYLLCTNISIAQMRSPRQHPRPTRCAPNLQVAPEAPDSRDWRARTQLPAQPEVQGNRQLQDDRLRPTAQVSAQATSAPAGAAAAPPQQRQRPSAQQQATGTQAPTQEPVHKLALPCWFQAVL